MSAGRWARALIYDAAIVGMTAAWYRAVLDRVPSQCRLLDVGIGTGSALLANAAVIAAKQLRITGVDIDAAYIDRCRDTIARRALADRIDARHESVYEHRGGPYDAVYFSASFMLLPDAPAALRHVCALLTTTGRIYFTQTFEHRRSPAMERVKPLLRAVTTIDFGRVTYEHEFRRALTDGGVDLQALEVLHAGRRRSAVIAIAAPR